VAVIDRGPGIPPEARLKLFDPFCTTKAKGTGLVLAIGRRIVEAHGGQLTVTDAQDRGVAFNITLPRGTS
jgi:C4-dicarboxylate-specific signal transduction histidine kinase